MNARLRGPFSVPVGVAIRGFIFAVVLPAATVAARAADQPQWGQAWSRNMVSLERGLPDSFDPKSGKNIKWIAKLGTESHSTPVVAGGRVYIGTNNGEPRDPRHQGDRGVLMCLEEQTGTLLWQLVVPKREEDPYFDWPKTGMSSPVTVEGDFVYLVNNRGEVMCLDAQGMANGNDGPFRDEGRHMTPRHLSATNSTQPASNPKSETRNPEPVPPGPSASAGATMTAGPLDADVVWIFDLTRSAGIWSHDAAHSSILIHGDYLYINTGTGVDNTHKRIRTPDAPSLVVIDKRTGRWVARDDEHIAPRIFHCTWSSPSLGEVNGRSLIFFAGGDGVVYAFEALPLRRSMEVIHPASEIQKLRKVWQFDIDPTAPKQDVHRYNSNRREGPSNIHGMPVFYEGRIYIAGGGDLFWGKNESWLKCVDATKTGDITHSAELWSYPLGRHVYATVAVKDDLLFIADCGRTVHCLNARTGQPYWTHECRGEFWASPMVADGKVFIGSRQGDFWVFAASREKKILSDIELGSPLSATATPANGVLYVATMTRLYAVQKGKE